MEVKKILKYVERKLTQAGATRLADGLNKTKELKVKPNTEITNQLNIDSNCGAYFFRNQKIIFYGVNYSIKKVGSYEVKIIPNYVYLLTQESQFRILDNRKTGGPILMDMDKKTIESKVREAIKF